MTVVNWVQSLVWWLARICSLGVPAACAAQDGSERDHVPWDVIDVLFVAGSTDWKIGSAFSSRHDREKFLMRAGPSEARMARC